MPPSPSVHDNSVYAISISLENHRIVLHTAFREKEPIEYTDVIFSGVLAHKLQNALSRNILFDVTEVTMESLVNAESELFKESWRYCWPEVEYMGDLELLKSELSKKSIRAFSIESSYGLSGWVLAVECVRISRDKTVEVA